MPKLKMLLPFFLFIMGCCFANQKVCNVQQLQDESIANNLLNALETDLLDIRNNLPWDSKGSTLLITASETRDEVVIPFADVFFKSRFDGALLDSHDVAVGLQSAQSKIKLGWLNNYMCDRFICLEKPENMMDVSRSEIDQTTESDFDNPFPAFELNYSEVYSVSERDMMIGFLVRIIIVRQSKFTNSWKVYRLRGIEYKYYFWFDNMTNEILDFKREVVRFSPY